MAADKCKCNRVLGRHEGSGMGMAGDEMLSRQQIKTKPGGVDWSIKTIPFGKRLTCAHGFQELVRPKSGTRPVCNAHTLLSVMASESLWPPQSLGSDGCKRGASPRSNQTSEGASLSPSGEICSHGLFGPSPSSGH